jgi:hypothetical protein
LALFGQDEIKLAPPLTAVATLRYQIRPKALPTSRRGQAWHWSPDKKSTRAVHLRAGIFHDPNSQVYATEVYRLNGTTREILESEEKRSFDATAFKLQIKGCVSL